MKLQCVRMILRSSKRHVRIVAKKPVAIKLIIHYIILAPPFCSRFLRELTLSTLCIHGDKETVNKSQMLFTDWMRTDG